MIQLIQTEEQKFNRLDDLKDYVDGQDSRFIPARFGNITVHEEGIKIDKINFYLRECGLKSICTRLKMPIDYANNIPTDLFVDSANRLIKEQPNKPITVNILDKSIRAVHSGRYLPITNKKVLSNFNLPKDVEVKRINISDEYLSMAFTNPNKPIKVDVGDIVECGAELNNSETGYRTFAVVQYVYQLICSNGARMAEVANSVRKIHLGYEDFNTEYYMKSMFNFLNIDTRNFEKAFKKMKNETIVDKFLKSIGDEIKLTLGKNNTAELVDNWMKNETSAYRIYSDITKIAHTRELSFNRQQYMERIGGKILTKFMEA